MYRLFLSILVLAISACGTSSSNPSPSPSPHAPLKYLVTDEAPGPCSSGGPIYQIEGNQASIWFQGNGILYPRSGEFDSQGNLILADAGAGILRITPQKIVTVVAARPPYNPRDVFIDSKGNYIVADWPAPASHLPPLPKDAQPAIWLVTPSGKVSLISQGGLLLAPHSVTVGLDGNYLVADSIVGIVKITPSGQQSVLAPVGGLLGVPSGIRTDKDGSYLVSDIKNAALVRVTSSGKVTYVHQGDPITSNYIVHPGPLYGVTGGPRDVAIAPDGTYLVVDDYGNQVYQIDRSGKTSVIFNGSYTFCFAAGIIAYP